ncbi:MAG: hypothetical protein O3A82_16045 [Verrucomicrobia bacterium]|nr:hypothetical protein [Verrucomicrobiota bacterium]
MKKLQYSAPLIKKDSEVYKLERNYVRAGGDDPRDENWLQELVYENPSLLPVDEIESAFLDLHPLCRELPTKVGSLDVLYVNESGLLTLVECKLWKNPEARREVVGQILDYAQELSRWDYEDLDEAVKKCEGLGVIEKLKRSIGDAELNEVSFIDSVTKNLKRGRFLLLILGEGIREGVENISEFLQKHAALNFSFALVEEALFELPKELGGGFLVQPRILCKTLEVERAVIRISGDEVNVVSSNTDDSSERSRSGPSNISDQIFHEELAKSTTTQVAEETKKLFAALVERGLDVTSQQLRIIKTEERFVENDSGNLVQFNFARINKNGTVDFKGWSGSLGVSYKEKLASLGKGWTFVGNEVDYNTNVRNASGDRIKLDELLEIKDDWLNLVDRTLELFKASLRDENTQ